MSPRAVIFFIVVLAAAASSSATTTDVQPVEAGQGVQPEYGRRRPIHWPWWPWPTPSPPPPTDPWWCNRTYGSEALSGTDDVDCPPPPAPTTPPPSFPWPCLCPRWPRPSSVVSTASATTTTDCLAPLAAVKSCGPFLTGADDRTPTLTSACCTGMRTVLKTSAADGGGLALLVRARPCHPARALLVPAKL